MHMYAENYSGGNGIVGAQVSRHSLAYYVLVSKPTKSMIYSDWTMSTVMQFVSSQCSGSRFYSFS